jgi:hypothetical protein
MILGWAGCSDDTPNNHARTLQWPSVHPSNEVEACHVLSPRPPLAVRTKLLSGQTTRRSLARRIRTSTGTWYRTHGRQGSGPRLPALLPRERASLSSVFLVCQKRKTDGSRWRVAGGMVTVQNRWKERWRIGNKKRIIAMLWLCDLGTSNSCCLSGLDTNSILTNRSRQYG